MGSFLAVAVNITVILLTIDYLQHRALALSISCAMTANFLFLFIALYKKLKGFSLSYLFIGLGKVFIGALLMGLYLHWLRAVLIDWMQKGFFNELVGLFFFIASGAAVYGIALYLLKLQEFKLVIDKILTKVKGN
jgi:putative peptidoglycan lipid II flippase